MCEPTHHLCATVWLSQSDQTVLHRESGLLQVLVDRELAGRRQSSSPYWRVEQFKIGKRKIGYYLSGRYI